MNKKKYKKYKIKLAQIKRTKLEPPKRKTAYCFSARRQKKEE